MPLPRPVDCRRATITRTRIAISVRRSGHLLAQQLASGINSRPRLHPQ